MSLRALISSRALSKVRRPVIFRGLAILVSILFFSMGVNAETHILKIKLGEKIATKKNVADLAEVHELFQAKKFDECIKKSQKLEKKYLELKVWLAMQRLSCALAGYRTDNQKYYADLNAVTQMIWKNPEWILLGPQIKRLRTDLVEGSLLLLELGVKKNRSAAWVDVSRLLDVREWLSGRHLAMLYRYAGDLSFADQNLQEARDYYERSLDEEPNRQLTTRLNSILKTLDPQTTKSTEESVLAEVQATPQETEIYKRMLQMQKSGDLVAAVEDGVKLIVQFPGSKNSADAAKKILSMYLVIAAKPEEKYLAVKERLLNEMKKVDGQRLFDWAQTLSAREFYSDALAFTKSSLSAVGGQPFSTQVLMLSAMTAYHSANFKFSKMQFEKLVKEHAGTRVAAEARYRLGLIEYRAQNYAEAASNFEQFLQLDFYSDFEQASLYWLWRAQQNLKRENSGETAQRLITTYPLSYYGLRARVELASNKMSFNEKHEPTPSWSVNLTRNEKESWDRFQILIQAGWVEEAQAELSFLNEPSQANGKLLYAYIWSVAQNYYISSETLSRAFAEEPSLISIPTLRVAYPTLYSSDIKKESAKYKIPPELVLALIKQESSFRYEVASPAGALGLMQLMPVTAREVAGDMKIKIKDLSQDLIQPLINIKIGTQYLHRRLRAFEGSVPLALASYNAGIGNVRNWLKARTDLNDLQKSQSSAPRDELWFDELPWSETTSYVKAILRNYLIYKLLDQGEYEFSDPLWKF